MRDRLIWGAWTVLALSSFAALERHAIECRCYGPYSETLSWALGTAPPRRHRYFTLAGFASTWLWLTWHLATYTLTEKHHETRTHPHPSRRSEALSLEL